MGARAYFGIDQQWKTIEQIIVGYLFDKKN